MTLLTRIPRDKKHGIAIENLQKIGVEVFFDDRLHAKMLLFDRELVMIMSSNIVLRSMIHNHEVGIISVNSGIINDAVGYIQYLEDSLKYPITSRSDELFKAKKDKVRGFIGKLVKRKEIEEESEVCPECKKPLKVREGKYGKFWGCTGYPECRFTRNIEWKEPK
ncbi:MAG: topoisomerase DNA-binding C4 zinc finger domain-containing protein [Promethearchaeota archaeon]